MIPNCASSALPPDEDPTAMTSPRMQLWERTPAFALLRVNRGVGHGLVPSIEGAAMSDMSRGVILGVAGTVLVAVMGVGDVSQTVASERGATSEAGASREISACAQKTPPGGCACSSPAENARRPRPS